jgi:hypothetical protein
VRFLGRRRERGERRDRLPEANGVTVELRTRSGSMSQVETELVRHGRTLARARARHVGPQFVKLDLDARHTLAAGSYTLIVRQRGRTLIRRTVHLHRPLRSGGFPPNRA